jgi:hypothetical protein
VAVRIDRWVRNHHLQHPVPWVAERDALLDRLSIQLIDLPQRCAGLFVRARVTGDPEVSSILNERNLELIGLEL